MRLRINDEFKSFPLMRKNDTYPVRIHIPAQLTKQELAFYFKYRRKDRSKAPHLSNAPAPCRRCGQIPAVRPGEIVISGNSAATSLRRGKSIPSRSKAFESE